ncbi:hypothetical protein [Serratia entomophila]|uniref:hypothetical protein n=1 Tax=Serratia entomophila TaxID=42906 RepID=UPI0021B74894|nr:hypothetical protein [Serratia entomophila]
MVIFIIIFGWTVVSAGYCSHQTAGKRHANHSWWAAGETGKCTNDSPHPNLISTGALGAAAGPIAIAAVVSIPTAANQFHLSNVKSLIVGIIIFPLMDNVTWLINIIKKLTYCNIAYNQTNNYHQK